MQADALPVEHPAERLSVGAQNPVSLCEPRSGGKAPGDNGCHRRHLAVEPGDEAARFDSENVAGNEQRGYPR